MRVLLCLFLLLGLAGPVSSAPMQAEPIQAIMGVKVTTTSDGVLRVSWPRQEVPVRVDGLALDPFLGLGTWAAFQGQSDHAMVMGDTVLFEDEVNPAMDAAFASGLSVTALHNHFFYDQPRVYFMHIEGHGNAEQLARGVRAVWDAARAVRKRSPEPGTAFPGGPPAVGDLPAGEMQQILGVKPEARGDLLKFTVGRTTTMGQMSVGGSMGLTTWMGFAGNEQHAIVDGDFAMLAEEVQPVLQCLRRNGIYVVALHNHMIGETPKYYFVHFWGKGPAVELARGLRQALDLQKN
ncbi:MAG: hypothetical protein AMXMBFR33_20540 [Candidatus Xenobia bacterium]